MADTLYISDLDGTLLNSQSRVSQESLSILNPLIDRGLMFAAATARTPATVSELLKRLHYSRTPSGRDIPDIVLTGAGYWNRRLQRYDYLRMLSKADTDIIAGIFRDHGVHPFQYCNAGNDKLNVYHPLPLSPREETFYRERRKLRLKQFHLGATAKAGEPTVLFFAMGEAGRMERICADINTRTDSTAAWYRDLFNPEVALMDVYAPETSKAYAVKDIATELGVGRVVVFGDNLNDLPMMELADLSVATSNALEEVKAKADIVIGSNDTDAVARFIVEDFDS